MAEISGQYGVDEDEDEVINQTKGADGIAISKQGLFTDMMVNGQLIKIVDPKFVETIQRRLITTENRVRALENDLRNLRDSIRRKDDTIARFKNKMDTDDWE